MNSTYSVAYFIVGVIFGGVLMWFAQERNIDLTEKQLDILSSNISQNISSKMLDDKNSVSDYSVSNRETLVVSANIELVNKIRDEVSLVISDELQEYKDGMRERTSNDLSNKEKISDEDYGQYNQAQLLLNDAVNNQQMTFQQFVSDPNVTNLPKELRDKIMGEVVMKLNSGELDPEMFVKRHN